MAEKEYIERGALIEMLNNKAKTDHEMGLYNHGALTESFIRFVERQPAADVVEVVRCKDCACFKQSVSALFPHTNSFICDYPYGLQKNVSENDFCCHGERKETDNG